MSEVKTVWDKTVEANAEIINNIAARSTDAHAFVEKLRTRTSLYLEMRGACDQAFSTEGSFLDIKLLAAWLVSAQSPELMELNLEWRISFCATCFEKDQNAPYHVDLVKA